MTDHLANLSGPELAKLNLVRSGGVCPIVRPDDTNIWGLISVTEILQPDAVSRPAGNPATYRSGTLSDAPRRPKGPMSHPANAMPRWRIFRQTWPDNGDAQPSTIYSLFVSASETCERLAEHHLVRPATD